MGIIIYLPGPMRTVAAFFFGAMADMSNAPSESTIRSRRKGVWNFSFIYSLLQNFPLSTEAPTLSMDITFFA